MIRQISAPRLKGHRFPRSIISYAVLAYYRFSLSMGGEIRAAYRETGPRYAPTDTWRLDEVVIMINGVRHWLWRGGSQRQSSRDPRANAPQCAGGEAFHFTADRPLG